MVHLWHNNPRREAEELCKTRSSSDSTFPNPKLKRFRLLPSKTGDQFLATFAERFLKVYHTENERPHKDAHRRAGR